MGSPKQSGNLVICNHWKLANLWVRLLQQTPVPGSLILCETQIAIQFARAYREDEIIIFSPMAVRKSIAGALGGVNVSSHPMRIPPQCFDLADVWRRADAAQLAFKIDTFLALSSAMMASLRRPSRGGPSIITECVKAARANARAARECRRFPLRNFTRYLSDSLR